MKTEFLFFFCFKFQKKILKKTRKSTRKNSKLFQLKRGRGEKHEKSEIDYFFSEKFTQTESRVLRLKYFPSLLQIKP